ncbi:MAG: FKBP-type peptidyl-prolyl cis-trans isomerase [Coxiellaceae bacterium]|nr:FKBP-type peptidyl-prolyl cis-trans isomerase [Coxiellaceae bacterium]
MKRTFSTILAVTGLSLVAFNATANSLNSKQDKLSYSIGVQTGKAFQTHNVQINPKVFAAGLADAQKGGPYEMTDADMTATLAAFRKESLEKLKAQIQHLSAVNSKNGAAFLAANKKKSGVKITASGLQYKIIKKGHGKPPSLTDTVTVNYRGSLINGKVFDSSYQRGKPVTFPVNGVIKGWQEALQMMKPGAVWMLYIPSDLAYGSRGAPGAIGPNEVLIFKVQLISVKR